MDCRQTRTLFGLESTATYPEGVAARDTGSMPVCPNLVKT
jgi:hypothetical protein